MKYVWTKSRICRLEFHRNLDPIRYREDRFDWGIKKCVNNEKCTVVFYFSFTSLVSDRIDT